MGFVPARVIARVGGELPEASASSPEPEDEGDAELSEAGARLKQYLELVRDALEIEASVSIRERAETLVGTFHGRELGLAIGKRGQTIDAIQQLAGRFSTVWTSHDWTSPSTQPATGTGAAPRSSPLPTGRRRAWPQPASRRARADDTGGAQDRPIRLKDRGDVLTESSGRRAEPVRGRPTC